MIENYSLNVNLFFNSDANKPVSNSSSAVSKKGDNQGEYRMDTVTAYKRLLDLKIMLLRICGLLKFHTNKQFGEKEIKKLNRIDDVLDLPFDFISINEGNNKKRLFELDDINVVIYPFLLEAENTLKEYLYELSDKLPSYIQDFDELVNED